ncbi:UDP-N-acetylglucosamine 2-epimerase, partial [Candidatus Bipolaricaulota bacterium]|nr:UDP-N-acetylglucosamine 2-epimerase [Candidatus Bipolaricaulota bacterium]
TFIRLMLRCSCMIGNSSAAIREGAFLGVPAVNVGTRQDGRERGTNVRDVGYDTAEIVAAAAAQREHGRYPSDPLYGDGQAGQRIADILATAEIKQQKRITY